MGSHPLNLVLRFLLEIAALVAIGYWGFSQQTGLLRFLLGIGLPVIAAAIWATFAVPDDPSRSGRAPVPVPGVLRLVLELALFVSAVWALVDAGSPTLALIMASITVVHYALSYDRVAWLIRQPRAKSTEASSRAQQRADADVPPHRATKTRFPEHGGGKSASPLME